NVLGINVLAPFGDDHVLLATKQLQVTGTVEPAEVAGKQPPVNNRLGGQFGIIQVVRHNGRALSGHFADAFPIRIENSQSNSRQRLAYRIRAKRFQVVNRQYSAGLAKTVSIGDGNSQVVEELKSSSINERAAGNQSQQFASEGSMDGRQQLAAEFHSGA